MANDLSEQMEQTLTMYATSVNEQIQSITRESMQELVRETKAHAPVGRRKGQFKRNITADYQGLNRRTNVLQGTDLRAIWYVKAPDYRLTHLLVHGHATKDGGRTSPDPFLRNALNRVLPEYERKVQEAIRNGN